VGAANFGELGFAGTLRRFVVVERREHERLAGVSRAVVRRVAAPAGFLPRLGHDRDPGIDEVLSALRQRAGDSIVGRAVDARLKPGTPGKGKDGAHGYGPTRSAPSASSSEPLRSRAAIRPHRTPQG
jgi:hypothetical protein